MINLENVSKTYIVAGRAVTAIRDLSLKIDDREFVAMIGPSGSGKSTVLAIIGAMNPPSAGKVYVAGTDVYALSGDELARFRRRYVGFVFQEPLLLPYLTVAENVMLPLLVGHHGPGRLERVLTALDWVGLADKAGRLPGQLSGGEQSRVAIARAVVSGPSIILADEPTGNLDSKTSEEIIVLLRWLNAAGHTIVIVTHNPMLVRYADRVIHLRDGMIWDDRRGTKSITFPLAVDGETPCCHKSRPAPVGLSNAASQVEDQLCDSIDETNSEWLIVGLIVLGAAIILSIFLFVLQLDTTLVHSH